MSTRHGSSGGPAVAALYAVAAQAGHGVLESAWHRNRAVHDLAALPGAVVEVLCRCDPELRALLRVALRYREPPATSTRIGFPQSSWNDEVASRSLAAWPVIEVDTDPPVDVDALVVRVRASVQR